MNNLCEAFARPRDIRLNQQDAEQFVRSFDTMLNALSLQESGDGFTVNGQVTCLGLGHIPESDSDTGKSTDIPCLRRQLVAKNLSDKFSFQGVCAQDTHKVEVVPPVEHEGFLMDFNTLTVRDRSGKEFPLRRGSMKLLKLLSHTPQTYDELIVAYNEGLEPTNKVSREAIWVNLRHLEKVLGKSVIVRTPDRKVMIAGDQEN